MIFQRNHSLDLNPGLSDLDSLLETLCESFFFFFVVPISILGGVRWYNSVLSKEFLASQLGVSGRVCLMAE